MGNKCILKYCVLLFVLLTISFWANAQTVKGRVIDKVTNEPIPFASVYFSGSFMGTSTGENGYFELNVPMDISMPLLFSAIGYYSFSLTDFSTGEPYNILLTPKAYELQEVVVTSNINRRARNRKLDIFREQFLGSNRNARNCKILNEEDIAMVYTSDGNTLKAFSSSPLYIYNSSLGYNIEYFMDKFEYREADNHLLLVGNYIFSPDTTGNYSSNRISSRRESAYHGSRKHFFRTLWSKNIEAQDYTIRDQAGNKLTYDDLVHEADIVNMGGKRKYLKHPGTIYIYYKKGLAEMLYGSISMVSEYELVHFDRWGYFDPMGIVWSGIMGEQRIGDLLPFEYGF